MGTDAEIMESLKKLRPTKKRKTKPKTKAGKPSKELPAQPGPGSLICSACGSPYVVYHGKPNGKDRLKCADCGKTFNAPPGYVHHKQPANTLVGDNSPPPPAPLDAASAAPPLEPPQDDAATNKQLNDLQAALSKLSTKALKKLNNLLDDPNGC